jgi:hypothetical protein
LKKALQTFFTIVVVAAAMSVAIQIHNIQRSLESMNHTLDQIQFAMASSYEEAVEESLQYAPKEYTRWQLRGNAQQFAQAYMDKLTDKHNLPRYELPTIAWRGVLNNPNAAGEATNCYINGRGTGRHFPYRGRITLNEILFLRNYEEFMYIVIPHEVAHIFSCVQGGFVYDDHETDWEAEHGPEWEQAMKDLGFIDPTKFKNHHLDMIPVVEYTETLIDRIGEALGDERVQEE